MSTFSLVSPFLYYLPICLLRGHFLDSCYVLGTVWFWERGSCPAFKQKQGSANISRNWWLRSACRRRVLGTFIIARVACSTSHRHERPDRETRVAGAWGVRGFENLCCVCQFLQVCTDLCHPRPLGPKFPHLPRRSSPAQTAGYFTSYEFSLCSWNLGISLHFFSVFFLSKCVCVCVLVRRWRVFLEVLLGCLLSYGCSLLGESC